MVRLAKDDSNGEDVILKRMKLERGETAVLRSGKREEYFNLLLLKKNSTSIDHIGRFVEAYTTSSQEYNLVFKDAGRSLYKFLYHSESFDERTEISIMEPSDWWVWLKKSSEGTLQVKSMMKQLFLAVQACHRLNITYRDIKPENILLQGNLKGSLHLSIIDFGSALDLYSLGELYGGDGPSEGEQTQDYAAPETRLFKNWLYYNIQKATAYDIWSIGVVFLEMHLGTPHVFDMSYISPRDQARLRQQLLGVDVVKTDQILMLKSYLDLCIPLPGISPEHHSYPHAAFVPTVERARVASWGYSDERAMEEIRKRDPMSIGFPNRDALHLCRSLLQWYPEDRISSEEALLHPYFRTT